MLRIGRTASVPAPEHLFTGENGTSHFLGNALKKWLLVAQRTDNGEMILDSLRKDRRWIESKRHVNSWANAPKSSAPRALFANQSGGARRGCGPLSTVSG